MSSGTDECWSCDEPVWVSNDMLPHLGRVFTPYCQSCAIESGIGERDEIDRHGMIENNEGWLSAVSVK